ncbi:MAG: hypothetical protein EA360_01290 [Balneolaceae bacterium]|nr:MAG: hypothetical protein EA360_01290 [Balneolaceae bacterium]
MNSVILNFIVLLLLLPACSPGAASDPEIVSNTYQITKTVRHNGLSVDLVIDKPEQDELDVLIVFRGTVRNDSLIVQAAKNALDRFKNILERKDLLIVSVAYPEENLLFGDNIQHSEAALLWVRNSAAKELGIKLNRIFLAGHSQGGYLVTRLNTMHPTNGVVANAPGPLNLVFRCKLEERGQVSEEMECRALYNEYGSVFENPDAYYQRSLLNFTDGFKSNILFIQGLNDSPIQMYSWPLFKEQIENCANCSETIFKELDGYGHTALFNNREAIDEFNRFLSRKF